jgi:hypothetical protein
MFQRSGPLQKAVWDKMMRGLSTRNYGAVVREFQQAYGIEKAAVSESFIEASRGKTRHSHAPRRTERPSDCAQAMPA